VFSYNRVLLILSTQLLWTELEQSALYSYVYRKGLCTQNTQSLSSIQLCRNLSSFVCKETNVLSPAYLTAHVEVSSAPRPIYFVQAIRFSMRNKSDNTEHSSLELACRIFLAGFVHNISTADNIHESVVHHFTYKETRTNVRILLTYFNHSKSSSVLYCLSCLPLNTRFSDSNPAEDDAFLRAIKSIVRLLQRGRKGGCLM